MDSRRDFTNGLLAELCRVHRTSTHLDTSRPCHELANTADVTLQFTQMISVSSAASLPCSHLSPIELVIQCSASHSARWSREVWCQSVSFTAELTDNKKHTTAWHVLFCVNPHFINFIQSVYFRSVANRLFEVGFFVVFFFISVTVRLQSVLIANCDEASITEWTYAWRLVHCCMPYSINRTEN